MELTVWIIVLLLLFIAISVARVVTILGKIQSSSEIVIKCLDAHELLIKESKEELAQQGEALEDIKNMMMNK